MNIVKYKIKIFEEVYAEVNPTNLATYLRINVKDDFARKAKIRRVVTTNLMKDNERRIVPLQESETETDKIFKSFKSAYINLSKKEAREIGDLQAFRLAAAE